MRLFPILTAALVVASLYVVIFERERAMEFAGFGADTSVEEANADAMAEDTEATMDEAAPEGAALTSVVAVKSTAQEISGVVLLRGRTEAARQVDVRAETSGKVVSDPLRKGSVVEAGQLLCQLDPGTREVNLAEARARLPEALARIPEAEARIPEAAGRLAEARARLSEAEINLSGAKKLFEDGFASETRVASAQAAFESAQAAVQSAEAGIAGAQSGVEAAQAGIQSAEAGIAAAEKEIERLTITAPFSGFLESDTAETGSLLQPGALCGTIIQLDPIKLVGFVPEVEVGRIEAGSRAGARLATGAEYFGQVTFLSRAADPTTRTFRVEVEISNTSGEIRDGQTVEIGIEADGQLAHLLPLSALTLDDDGNPGIRSVGPGGVVGFQEVTVLRDSVEGIWVAGLPPEIDVIIVGQEYVTTGVPVQVAYQEALK